ncbi:hypothetical protein CYFUS_008792 [Cystobacter fuscus]|uniref:Lipoprotein n=1 Tax=Cystobacter fuscus TaxID=43 RepID=A0A250JIL4_9BACT|nr:hypothetical protein [Cystobacter fuscus]ATB43312.1 hypothetical protein CYFUS_008792 [Cystobacter fuscus]
MQLRTMVWMRVALSALALGGTACGSLDLSCQRDQDCLDSELCHPDEQECVRRCSTNLDCYEARPKCQEMGSSNSTRICKA